jgi:hypothetical protein
MQHAREAHRRNQEHCLVPIVFTATERQERMSKNEKSGRKPDRATHDRDAKRRARDQALDEALEETFPASDPIAPSQPTPKLD